MTGAAETIDRAALSWLIRVQDPEFHGWDEWEAWLVQDPAHAAAFWRVAEADAELTGLSALPAARRARRSAGSRSAPARASRRRVRLGAGLAAAVALACVLGWAALRPGADSSIGTEPGEVRDLTLADGSIVQLAGDTRISVRRGRREVSLEQGRATFEVAHDDARPFVVRVGTARVTDLGTAFDVTRLPDGLRVGVSEGVVRVDGAGPTQTLEAGEGLLARAGRVERLQIEVEAVSSWRHGRLSYRRAELDLVAQDLSRALGRPVTLAAGLTGRPFTGSLDTSGGTETVKTRIETLLNVEVVEHAGGWRLEPGAAS